VQSQQVRLPMGHTNQTNPVAHGQGAPLSQATCPAATRHCSFTAAAYTCVTAPTDTLRIHHD